MHRLKWRSLIAIAASVIVMWLPLATFADPAGENAEETEPLSLTARPVERSLPPATASVIVPGGEDYLIGRQDLLQIKVFGVDELDQTVRVTDDGWITLPLLGRLSVSGLTKTGLEDLIASLLASQYMHDPQVTIFIKEYESKKVAVTGAVKKPGTYEMLGRKTLLEMISLAGGLDKDLGSQIFIFRETAEGQTARIPIDLELLVYEADQKLNHVIEAGDIIYVPAVARIRIFVSGAVKNPDMYEIPRDEPVTVLKAITLAGGTTDRAALKKVQIMRTEKDGTRTNLLVNLSKVKQGRIEDPILQKDDIVLVPESFF